MGQKNNRVKNILKSCAPLTYVIPLILFYYFFHIQLHPIWIVIVSLIPGVYSLSFAIFYGEMESALRGGGTYRDYKAVIISFQHFWFFMMFGLWVIPVYLKFPRHFEYWWSILATAGAWIIPLVIIHLLEMKNKNPILRMVYWIQTPDLNVEAGEQALTLKEAQNFISNYNWKKELFNKKMLEKRKKETCPPTIGLDYQGQIFTISSTGNNIFDLHIDTGNDRRDIKKLNTSELFKLIDYYYNKKYDKIFDYLPL